MTLLRAVMAAGLLAAVISGWTVQPDASQRADGVADLRVPIRLVVPTGNIDQAPSTVWLTDLVGDLMEQGTTTSSAYELAVRAARMGGSLDVGVGVNQFTVGGGVLSRFAADMLSLVGDVALRPAMPASALPRLKNDMLRRVSIARRSTSGTSRSRS